VVKEKGKKGGTGFSAKGAEMGARSGGSDKSLQKRAGRFTSRGKNDTKDSEGKSLVKVNNSG